MKKFIFKFSLFLFLPLVLIFLFDLYLRNINTLYNAKFNGLMEVKNEVEVVFLGNSHANYDIDPSYFKNFKVYNLANVTQTFYFDKRLLIKAMKNGVSNLKYVFISIDYHTFNTSSQGIRNVWSYYGNGIKYKDQDYTKEIISPFIWGYTPLVSLSLLKKDILKRIKFGNSAIDFDVEDGVNIQDSLFYGYLGREGTNLNYFNDFWYSKKANFFKEDTINSERMTIIKEISNFILFLKNENIEPILFSSPTYKEYNEYLDKEQIKRNIKDIEKICKKFNVQYWRFTEDSRFIKEDFYDMDHLNKKGASKFSILLNNKLNKFDKARADNEKFLQSQTNKLYPICLAKTTLTWLNGKYRIKHCSVIGR